MKAPPLFPQPRDKLHRRLGELGRLLGHPAVIPEVPRVRCIWVLSVPANAEHKSEVAVSAPAEYRAEISATAADERAVIVRVRRQAWPHGLPDTAPHDGEVAARRIILAERDVVTLDPVGQIGDVLRLQQRAGREPGAATEAAGRVRSTRRSLSPEGLSRWREPWSRNSRWPRAGRRGFDRVTLEARSRPGSDAALPDEIRLVRA